MKTILSASLLLVSSLVFAQSAPPPAERQAKPPSCDDLAGMEKEACLKRGGTVKANSAGSGASSAPSAETQGTPAPAVGSSAERTAEPDAKKDYTKPDSK